ncbi:hypothetical protein HMPREF9694_05493 [Klebsiella michiganensis]|nr:hypothetical protein HMPREF9694_05493 [Klebsiella michiganensis]
MLCFNLINGISSPGLTSKHNSLYSHDSMLTGVFGYKNWSGW